MKELLIFVVAFAFMELISYLAHRYIYHGIGWALHKSHHQPRKGILEWNDIFPMIFAAMTIVLLLYALSDPDRSALAAAGFGIMAYGLVYFFVHDLYIHRRARWLKLRIPFLQRLKRAHAIHHRYGGEPYGLLFVIDPDRLTSLHVQEDEPV